MMNKKLEVKIRPIRRDDAETSVKWRNISTIWKQTIDSPDRVISISDELNWIDKVLIEESSKRFAIEVDEKYIGNVQLTNIQGDESYFGIFIGEEGYWGKGIGTEATKLILNYAFDELKLKKVKLRVRVNNVAANSVYKGLGFVETDKDDEIICMELLNTNISQ